MTDDRLRDHDVRLSDGELVLRALTEADWDALVVWALDAEVLFLGELDDVPERTRGEVQAIVRQASQAGPCWMIELDGEPVGDIRLGALDTPRLLEARPDETMWDLALALTPSRWGQQLGRRAARLACAHAFEALDADSVWVHLGDHNPRALRMFYHLGFADAGVQNLPSGGKAFRAYDLALERERWERSR